MKILRSPRQRPPLNHHFHRSQLLIFSLLLASALLFTLLFQEPALAEGQVKEFTIVIDPGHGGLSTNNRDDKWDKVNQAYLNHYADGAHHKEFDEHVIAYNLSRQVKKYLDLTQTSSGRRRFLSILSDFSDETKLAPISLKVHMSRKEGLKDGNRTPYTPRVNDPYRLYDYPDASGKIVPGRISYINSLKPHLVVSIHLNPAGPNQKGGMAAVIAPGYKTFDMLRRISLKKEPFSKFRKSVWYNVWSITEPGWDINRSAISDTWVYFHGYRTKKNGKPWLNLRKGFRGYRHNMLTWRYNSPPGWEIIARQNPPGPFSLKHEKFKPLGNFWEREQSQAEEWRREGGLMGYGGDNHYASDELLRYIRYGAQIYLPERRKPGALGEILPPFASTYSLPTFVNAICAYLEVGHINRERDLSLLNDNSNIVAKSLAVGIYSLVSGLNVKNGLGESKPQGKSIDFSRYINLPEGNYFERVVKTER